MRYGEFDFRWMLHCMAIVESRRRRTLGITHKGIGVVEHYLMARRLMTRNIYHSQKKLALEQFSRGIASKPCCKVLNIMRPMPVIQPNTARAIFNGGESVQPVSRNQQQIR